MNENKNHKRMLLDIVNRNYVNCEKIIYQDYKECSHITEDFYNADKPLSYVSVDDLVFKTFFSLHPKIDTVENNTFNTINSIFTKEVYDNMMLVDEMKMI